MHYKRKTISILAVFIISAFVVFWIVFCYTPLEVSTPLITPTTSTELNTVDTLEMECIAYEHFTRDFTAITINELNTKIINKESFFLFTGRMTCEWCRKLVPVLSEVAANNKIEIFYLDSEATESDSKL